MIDNEKPTLAERFAKAPHLFDPDIAKLVRDTIAPESESAPETEQISNPTNLFTPTVLGKDTSRAGADRVSANYLGLIGPVSALPASYTHAAIVERKRRSTSLFAFLELFADEFRNLFVEAHRKYRLPSLFQLYRSDGQNRITESIYSICGLATAKTRAKLKVHEEIPLYYAGYFADQRRTAISLELMLNDFLGYPVNVQQFQRRRLAIPEDEQTRLGDPLTSNSILGQTAVAGASCFTRRGSIRITVGPLDYAQYLSLMPDGRLYEQLVELIRLYCGPSLNFDLQLILKKEHVPYTRLDSRSPVGRLGWDTWALQGSADKDSEETVFDPEFVKPSALKNAA